MKTDARVRYTVHMIQNVFLELLKEKPVAKITVKEICEHAETIAARFINTIRMCMILWKNWRMKP